MRAREPASFSLTACKYVDNLGFLRETLNKFFLLVILTRSGVRSCSKILQKRLKRRHILPSAQETEKESSLGQRVKNHGNGWLTSTKTQVWTEEKTLWGRVLLVTAVISLWLSFLWRGTHIPLFHCSGQLLVCMHTLKMFVSDGARTLHHSFNTLGGILSWPILLFGFKVSRALVTSFTLKLRNLNCTPFVVATLRMFCTLLWSFSSSSVSDNMCGSPISLATVVK